MKARIVPVSLGLKLASSQLTSVLEDLVLDGLGGVASAWGSVR